MNVANSKKSAPVHTGFEWAGAMARIQRRGVITRSGRRSLLLGVLSASQASNGRATRRAAEGRSTSNADRG
jgi:hypothetical protein